MTTLTQSLDAWVPEAARRLDGVGAQPRFEFVGRIASVGDGIARVSGLPETRADELLLFPGGVAGLAVDLDHDIGCILLGEDRHLAAGAPVHGTGAVVRVPVGDGLLGRVLDPLGRPSPTGRR